MSIQTLTEKEIIIGGWSAYSKPTSAQLEIFNQALTGFNGVKYTPHLISFQIVNGVNYRYKCPASLPHGEVYWEAIIEIFAPINDTPYVTGIIRI